MTALRDGFDKLHPSRWTHAEALHHLRDTFDRACREWPDIMEPYAVMVADAPIEHHREIMRCGLRETINERKQTA